LRLRVRAEADPGVAGARGRRRRGDDAPEVDVLLPEAPHGAGLQPAELRRARRSSLAPRAPARVMAAWRASTRATAATERPRSGTASGSPRTTRAPRPTGPWTRPAPPSGSPGPCAGATAASSRLA